MLLRLGLLFLLFAWPSVVSAQTANPAEQVLEELERALNAHDEERALALFATDSRLSDERDVTGREQLRAWVREQVAGNIHIHLGAYSAEDGRTHFTAEIGAGEWYRDGQPARRTQGSAVVRNGRISSFALAPTQPAPRSGLLAVLPASSPASVPWLIVSAALLIVGGVLLLWSRTRAEPLTRSEAPAGSLLSALGAWSAQQRVKNP